MFKKSERLTREQFEEFFKKGKRFQTETITCLYTPLPQTHVAIVVGKKVAKKAHDRNLIRRRAYGAAYRRIKKEKYKGVYIFLTKPSFASLTKKQQLESVQKVLSRITMSQ